MIDRTKLDRSQEPFSSKHYRDEQEHSLLYNIHCPERQRHVFARNRQVGFSGGNTRNQVVSGGWHEE